MFLQREQGPAILKQYSLRRRIRRYLQTLLHPSESRCEVLILQSHHKPYELLPHKEQHQ